MTDPELASALLDGIAVLLWLDMALLCAALFWVQRRRA